MNVDSFTQFIEAALDSVGLGFLSKDFEKISDELDNLAQAFRIPADLDDSSVNLAMGGMLLRLAPAFPTAYALWEKVNANISALYDIEVKVRNCCFIFLYLYFFYFSCDYLFFCLINYIFF